MMSRANLARCYSNLDSNLFPDFSGRNRLPLLLAKLKAIRRSLIRKDTRILIHKVTRREGASCNPSRFTADMIAMMSWMVTRVTTMPTRVASMSSAVPSSTCKRRCRAEGKGYADD